jgi:hypothetical protein
MYRCEECSSVVGPGVSQIREVVETRFKRYPVRENANHVMKHAKRKRVLVDDPGGTGREIVRERSLCPSCKP